MAVIGTFGSFTAARLGIYASQASLNVTGNNIANINTKGYTRQRLDLVSLHAGGSSRYANSYNLDIGYGVISDGVSQLRDPFLDIRYRDEQSSVGSAGARLDGLQQMSNILDEVGRGTDDFGIIEAQFNDFMKQLEILSRNAGSDVNDTTVRSSAETLVSLFNSYANGLSTVKKNLTDDLKDDVHKVNTILEQIRDLNKQIRNAGIHGDNALELRDERNLLIDELSSYMKIDVRYDMEKIDEFSSVERINISIADSGNPPIKLVQGIYASELTMAKSNPDYDPNDPGSMRYLKQLVGADGKPVLDADGKPMYEPTDNAKEAAEVDSKSDGDRLWMQLAELKDERGRVLKEANGDSQPVDLSDTILYGSIQAKRELITEEGEFASSMDITLDSKATTKRGIPYYQHAIDVLARKFAETFNEANKKAVVGYETDENGKPDLTKPIEAGGNLFSNSGDGDSSGTAGDPDDPLITAANISVAKSWTTGEVRIRNTEAYNDTNHTTDSKNIDHMIALMESKLGYKPGDITDLLSDPPANADKTYFEGSFQEMLRQFNVTLATDQQTTNKLYESYTNTALNLDNDRSSVSGVDLNDEATSMMMFQKSYSAACQLMTTLDSMLDKLINGTMR